MRIRLDETPAICPLCASVRGTPIKTDDGKVCWECGGCDLIFVATQHHLDPQLEWARYRLHENRPDDDGYRQFLGRLADVLMPRLPPASVGLDYGSGPGPTLSVMLEEKGFRMTNFDPFFAPDTAALARRYDFVTCTETAEHFRRPAEEFQRLDGLLHPGGWLGVMTELRPPRSEFASWYYHRDPTHLSFYSERTLLWIADRFGWAVEFPRPNVALFQKR